MAKKKHKPMTPEQIALRAASLRAAVREALKNPEHWGADGDTLASQPDVTIVVGPKRKVQTARRDDVFDRFLARGALDELGHQAIRRLEADMIERRGEGFRNPSNEVVDSSSSKEIVTQRMIDAGKRVDMVLGRVGLRDKALIRELLEPKQVILPGALGEEGKWVEDKTPRWQQVVRVLAGETDPVAMAGVIRSSCANLAMAYKEIDNEPRRATR